MRNENINLPHNSQSCQTSVIGSTGDFIRSKKISIYEQPIIDENNKSHSIFDLLNEYAVLYSKKYLCYAEIIQMIDDSENLKELEILINRKFKR